MEWQLAKYIQSIEPPPFLSGVDSMPQDLQRYVTQLREIELEKRGKNDTDKLLIARTLVSEWSQL